MLKGYTVPKSPFGQAALTPPPPWHYSGDVVGVEFQVDPAAVTACLPSGLVPDPKTNGHAIMLFIDWQFTAQDDEYLDPARYQYREAFILVDAVYRDTPVMWCPYIYVDNDAALARGWTQGFQKKIGSVYQTRSHAAPSAAAAPVAPGGRFGASLSAHGQRLAEACVTLRKPVENGLSGPARQAGGERAGDVGDGQSDRRGRLDRGRRAASARSARRRAARSGAKARGIGLSLFAFLFCDGSENSRGLHGLNFEHVWTSPPRNRPGNGAICVSNMRHCCRRSTIKKGICP
jgi:hypothetical protein